MSLRIIAGANKGHRILTPPDRDIRPTTGRAREALFNILAPKLSGARFLDLFAGTGANGLEALSRGAAKTCFVDSDPQILDLIRQSSRQMGLSSRSRFICSKLPSGLDQLPNLDEGYDLIVADPPYNFDGYQVLLQGLTANRVVREGGLVVIEHQASAAIPDEAPPLASIRKAIYGTTTLSFFA